MRARGGRRLPLVAAAPAAFFGAAVVARPRHDLLGRAGGERAAGTLFGAAVEANTRLRGGDDAARALLGAAVVAAAAELRLDHGIRVGRKRVERLMRAAGLSGQLRRRRGKTTIRVQGVRTAPDLVQRDFNPAAINRLLTCNPRCATATP